jgi:arylsulfatase A
VGKWGLGFWDSTGDPRSNGFDLFFGYICQRKAHAYWPEYLWRNGVKLPLGGKQYSPDLTADEALDWVRRHKDEPFFLYFASTLPHARFEVPNVGQYAGKPWPDMAKRYAAMVSRLDSDAGRLLALLKELDLDRRTIVFFASDNGADNPARELFKSNGDLRGIKRTMYEGGLREPMIVRWPGHVPAGKTSDEVWAFYDFLPTAAELAGAKVPEGLPLDGISVVPALLGGKLPQRPYLYWELHEPHFMQAARVGDWKAVRPAPRAEIELYDLKTDRQEAHDVAAAHPDVVAKAQEVLQSAHVESPNWPVKAAGAKSPAARAKPKAEAK